MSTDFTTRAREESGGAFRSRTGLDGFAIRYITALLTRQNFLPLQAVTEFLLHKFGAGNETRTRDPDLGKVVLYQLSYSRKIILIKLKANHLILLSSGKLCCRSMRCILLT